MDPRLKRTKFAAHAATLAEQFEGELAGYPVGSHRVEMTVPEGSTGGGVQALQHIRLVPIDDEAPGLRSYVIGSANQTTKLADLRSYEYVEQTSLERFGDSTAFDAGQYATSIAVAAKFLTAWGFTVTRVASAAPATTTPRRAAASRFTPSVILMLVVWTLAVFAVGVVVGTVTAQARASAP